MKISWPTEEASAKAMAELKQDGDGCVIDRLVAVIIRHGGWVAEWDDGWRSAIGGRVPEKGEGDAEP